jgi:hypothetical protein
MTGNEGAADRPAAIASLPGLLAARDLVAVARVLVRLDWPQGRIQPWDESYARLVRDLTVSDVIELIHLIAREVRGSGANRPAVLLSELSQVLPDEVLADVCADWLTGAERHDGGGGVGWGGEVARMAEAYVASGAQLSPGVIAAVRRMASHPAWSGKTVLAELAATLDDPVLNPGEAWSDAALSDAATRGQAWQDLLGHAITAESAKPSARWEKTARGLLAAVGERAAAERISAWLALVGQPRTIPLIGRGRGAEKLFDSYNVAGIRGLAWMLGFSATDAGSARTLAALVRSALLRLPGLGPRAPRVANAAVYALSQMPGTAALAQLGRLAAEVTYQGTLTQLDQALQARAAEQGVSREVIEELAVPGFGLTEVGRRVERFGDASAEVVIRGHAVRLTWRTEAGKVAKSASARVRSEFADEVKELKSVVGDIEKMVSAQAGRLDRLFLARRSWDFAYWAEHYLDHPLVGTLARRLIWLIDDVPASHAEGGLRTLADAALTPAPDARVKLWHPIGRETVEISAWRDWLERHQVTQPFKQAHREVYPITRPEQGTRTYSNRFAAHILRQHQFHALAAQRGWQNRLRFMAEDHNPPPARHLPQWGIRAEFRISGIGRDYETDAAESGAFRYVTTDQVRFYPVTPSSNVAHTTGGGYAQDDLATVADEPIPLADVPPLVLSEIFRDIDLFVGVCTIGNDPTWEDRGPNDHYRTYWRTYNTGKLSETACTRADLLRRLLPRLAIGPQCAVGDRFLHVKGVLCSYKIHLGSGNVMTTPDDTYLCIVPDPHSRDPFSDVPFPFEGDQMLAIILSKAMLLANDTKITDPTITRQIRRSC